MLILVTTGPNDPTKAALAFLVARTALEEGHDVDVFLAGDAVELVKDDVLAGLEGLGTGKLQESFDAVVAGGACLYLSKRSSDARKITEAELGRKPAQLAPPNVLVQLAARNETVLTF